MHFNYKNWLLVIALLFCVSSTFAQTQPQTTKPEDVIKINTTLVNIPVTAKDKKGEYLSNLEAEDFVVYENGVKQKIELFSKENTPANILVMMESANTNPKVFPYAKLIANTLVEKLRSGDTMAIISFEDRLIANTNRFTDDQTELKQALSSATASISKAKLRDAIFLTTEKVLAKVPGRKILVIISTGEDKGSTYSEKEAISKLIESDTIVYSLYFPPTIKLNDLNPSQQVNVLKGSS
jgi:VWFA-related protein